MTSMRVDGCTERRRLKKMKVNCGKEDMNRKRVNTDNNMMNDIGRRIEEVYIPTVTTLLKLVKVKPMMMMMTIGLKFYITYN